LKGLYVNIADESACSSINESEYILISKIVHEGKIREELKVLENSD
tara:strand:- start:697 stop:834 length:138 start_codon:yes stop_codon:yes gene_type:complete